MKKEVAMIRVIAMIRITLRTLEWAKCLSVPVFFRLALLCLCFKEEDYHPQARSQGVR